MDFKAKNSMLFLKGWSVFEKSELYKKVLRYHYRWKFDMEKIRPKKKKDVCLPFSDQPKILENKGHIFFLILNFAFLNKIIKIKCQNI